MFGTLARIDGVGSVTIGWGQEWTVGRVGGGADWTFQAHLRSRALHVARTQTGWQLTAADRPASLVSLPDPGDVHTLELEGVCLALRQPHPWTPSAVLATSDGRRSAEGSDRLLLACGPVLIGADPHAHIVIPDAEETIVLFLDDADSQSLAWRTLPADVRRGTPGPVNRLALPALIDRDHMRFQLERLEGPPPTDS